MRRWMVGGGTAVFLVLAVAWGIGFTQRAERHNKAGIALFDRGDYGGAIPEFAQAVTSDPSMSKAHYNMGLSYAHLNQPDQAAACFRKALDADPANVAASRMLTRVSAAIDSRRLP